MVLGLCSGWLAGNNTINLDFWASFSLVHFFWKSKRNEQDYFGQAKESNMIIWRSKRTDPPADGEFSEAK
jgi:hypothetical protein